MKNDHKQKQADDLLFNVPIVVCDGWVEPRHPRKILKHGDLDRVSHGMCMECAATIYAADEAARGQ